MYFVITTNEDGEPRLSVMEKGKLLEKMNPDDDGYSEMRADEIHTGINGSVDLTARAGTYIIKGELVIPRPKKVVEAFEID